MSAARPPEGAKAPSGGSDPCAAGERGGLVRAARPPEGAKAPSGGSDPCAAGERGGLVRAEPSSTVVLSAPATPEQEVRVGLVAITRHGVAQALRLSADLPQAHLCTSDKFASQVQGAANPLHIYEGALSAQMAALMQRFDQLVFFVSLGAVVRLIAPHLKAKDEDPGVIVVDDAAQFVIPVLSGHVGGANAWSERVADLLGATPVLTTASDVGRTIPVDILGRHLGWRVEAPKINITRVSAHVVNGEPIAVVQEAGSPHWWTRPTPLPDNIRRFARLDDVDLDHYRAVLWITHAVVTPEQWQQLHERLVVYRPPQEGAP